MRALIAAVMLVPALASAQPGAVEPTSGQELPAATSPEILGLARGAHVAGARGDCVGARTLAARIERQDPDFYAAVISTDPSITACKPKPRVYAVDREEPSVFRRPAAASTIGTGTHAPLDSGRNVGGQLLLGGVMAAGLGFLGVLAGASSEEPGIILFSGIGLAAGASAGVILVGDNEGSDYSLGLTIAGSVTGSIIGWRIALGNNNNVDNAAFTIGVLVAAPTLGAMLGFNLSRRTLYPEPFRAGVAAAPRISDPTTSLPLLSGAF
jgi:hypothetical protein